MSSTSRIYISRHVVFNEQDFPFKFSFLNTNQSEQTLTHLPAFPLTNWQQEQNTNDGGHNRDSDQHLDSSSLTVSSPGSCSSSKQVRGDSLDLVNTHEYLPVTSERQLEDLSNAENGPMHAVEGGKQPLQNENRIVTRSMKGITKPKLPYVGILTEQPKNHATGVTVSTAKPMSIAKPESVLDALSSPHWKVATKDELDALKKNHTWDLVPYSSDLCIVDRKWVFKTKFKSISEVDTKQDLSQRDSSKIQV